MQPAIFLDRDGVINIDISITEEGEDTGREVTSVGDVKIYPEVREFLKTATKNGYKIIVVTNQSKVGRGLITMEELHNINRTVNELSGNHIHSFYVCPHRKEEGCNCRKPNTGMITEAAKDHSVDLGKSWIVGDKIIDIKAGKDAGIRTILLKTGYGGRDGRYNIKPDYVAENLRAAGKIIFGN